MPLTKLDTIPALVVIDLQKGIVGLPTDARTSLPPIRTPRVVHREKITIQIGH